MKKLTKAIATVGLTGGLVLSIVGNASAATVHYKDIKETDNYYTAVENLLEQEAISNTLPNFRPNEQITRGQAASILVKVLDLEIEKVKDPGFKDVPKDHQFYPYIAALANEGILGGKSDGSFGINEPLKRGQMSAILTKAFDIPLVSIYDVDLDKYKDLYTIKTFNANSEDQNLESDRLKGASYFKFSNQFSQHAYTMDYFGFASGYPKEKRFGINDAIKRSQFALMIEKIQESEGKHAFLHIDKGYDLSPIRTSYNTATGVPTVLNEVTVKDQSILTIDTYIGDVEAQTKYNFNQIKESYNSWGIENDVILFNLHKEGTTTVNVSNYDNPNDVAIYEVEVKKVNGKLKANFTLLEPGEETNEPATSEESAEVISVS